MYFFPTKLFIVSYFSITRDRIIDLFLSSTKSDFSPRTKDGLSGLQDHNAIKANNNVFLIICSVILIDLLFLAVAY